MTPDPITSALIPAAALLAFIYWKDRKSPEPFTQLLKATGIGILSIPLTFVLVLPLQWFGIVPAEVLSMRDAINVSFLGAAIPEELSKLFVLWLFLRRNKYFDERMDGIVYAVCVALAFAGMENIMYVIGDPNWVSTAITRAFTAVPAHFCFGVVMGYFYSLAKFVPTQRIWYSALALIAPIVAHGIYDTLAFSMGLSSIWMDLLIMLIFIVFCFLLWIWASRSIKRHIGK